MDRISLRESYGGSNDSLSPRSSGYARHGSQLPTPETSRSGFEPDEDEYQDEVAESGSHAFERRLHPPVDGLADASYATSKRSSSRRDSCNLRSPDSPPYRSTDSQRLALPPLKSVLADGISSPPSTPTVYNRSFQPSPQEPAYTSTTYKPPALYPHKKQRTDALLEPVPWINRSSNANSRGLFRTPFEPPVSTHNAPKDSFNGPSISLNPYLSSAPRRRSANERPPSPLSSVNDYQTAPGPAHEFHRRDSRAEPYREESYVLDRERDHRDHYVRRSDAQYELVVRSGYSDRDNVPQTGRSAYFHSHASPNFVSGSYMGGQPALFLPGHGDYHLGKSRKRSNLPKESTDIMKQWFDQNIANPYPSEEQKALFSTATGISMNQVSNWFINHRRRCPELRDKRERARGRERDDR